MTKSSTDIPILDDDAVAEIAEMFPHAEYQPTLSPDEVDPCKFCNGTIDDHKANCVVPHVHALCATVRVLRAENERLKPSEEEIKVLTDYHYYEAEKAITRRGDSASQRLHLERLTRLRGMKVIWP